MELKTMTDEHKEWLHGLAYVFMQHLQYEKAIRLWLILKAARPKDGLTLKSLAYAYFKTDRHNESLQLINEYFKSQGVIDRQLEILKRKILHRKMPI